MLLLFHSKPDDAGPLMAKLRAAGYGVTLHQRPASVHTIANAAPAAAVIDLSRMPSHGRYIGAWLRGSKKTRQIPLVFVDGEAAKVARVREELPDAVYTTASAVVGALKRAIAKPPLEPVVPRQMMQGGSTRTTAQKLGIREKSTVGLIDPPDDYWGVLGALPRDVVLEEDAARPCDLTLWFVHDANQYAAQLRKYRTRKRLWIVWQKGRRDGLNGSFIREAALAVGLVDYKICSLDAEWSGLAFAMRS